MWVHGCVRMYMCVGCGCGGARAYVGDARERWYGLQLIRLWRGKLEPPARMFARLAEGRNLNRGTPAGTTGKLATGTRTQHVFESHCIVR